METNEITPEEQPEQIAQVEGVEDVQDVLADPDVQKLISGWQGEPEVSEEAEVEPAGEVAEVEAEAEVEPTTWIEDRDRRYAAAIGLSAEELAEFTGREELDRFGRMLAGRQVKQEPVKAAPEAKTEPAVYVDEPIVDGKLNVEWFKKHDYDDGQIAIAQANLDSAKELAEIKQQFGELQKFTAEQQRDRDLNDFHDALDRTDGEFFGKTLVDGRAVQISERLGERRAAVFAQLDIAHESLSRRLGHAPTMAQKVELATQLAWSKELGEMAQKRSEAAKKGQLTKVANQARKVRPAGSTPKTLTKTVADPESPEAMLADPERKALVTRIKEENAQ